MAITAVGGGGAVAALAALAIAVPTALIRNPLYTRMTPVTWWSWPLWVLSASLAGLLAATYVRTPITGRSGGGAGASGGFLGILAVGCPICNKLVVLALGVSGALQWWSPIQPILGVAGLGLLGYGLWLRLRGEFSCVRRTVRPAAED